MSAFSEKCKFYLESNNLTVYELSKISGIERTSLHRMVTGKRLPSEELIQKFSAFIRLNPREYNDLMELYHEEKLGREKYRNRKYICEIFEHLSETELSQVSRNRFQNHARVRAVQLKDIPECADTAFQTHNLLIGVLDYVFSSREKKLVYTNIPVNYDDFIELLYYMFYSYQNDQIQVSHFLTFLANPASRGYENYNLEMLNNILYLALSPFRGYQPFYNYCQYTARDIEQIPYPYYLITDDLAVELSATMRTAIVHTNPQHMSIYQNRMQEIQKDMRPLISTSLPPEEALKFYANFSKDFDGPEFVLESSPCLTWMVSDLSEIDHIVKQTPHPEELTELLQQSYGGSIQSRLPRLDFFTMEGIRSFARTGKLTGQIASYFTPLPPEKRLQALKVLYNRSSFTGPSFHILNSSISFPSNLYVESYGSHGIFFAQFGEDATHLKFCFINENSLCLAFTDYFNSLIESGQVLSTEEAQVFLRECISLVEKTIKRPSDASS